MKKTIIFAILFQLVACGDLQNIINQLPNEGILTQGQIGNGLKEALNNGIQHQVSKLTSENGFYNNQLVKIMLPEELKVVDEGLRKLGLGSIADEGIKALNRAAGDAVKTATPIFVNAVKEITFNDAKNILLGADNAATSYLQTKTSVALYSKFNPVIQTSFAKVGADQIWTDLITKYNSIPFVKKVNPNLTDYVTQQALKGVFTMIAKEEKGIRQDINMRTTNLLQRVFALQDNRKQMSN